MKIMQIKGGFIKWHNQSGNGQIIRKILHDLQEPYKEVFMLRVMGEVSYRDIGQLFSKSESWARVTYYRAKKMIVEKMGGAGNDEM